MEMEGIHSKKQIEVDVIMMNPTAISEFDYSESSWVPKTVQYLLRKREIKGFHSLEDDVIMFMRGEPEVNYRYFLQPEKTLLPEYDLLNFGIEYTGKVIEQGKVDAQAAIDLGPGKSFDKLKK